MNPFDDARGVSRRSALLGGTAAVAAVLAAGTARAATPASRPSIAAAAAAGGEPVGELWLPEVDNNTIAVIDTATRTVTRRIRTPFPGARPAVLAPTPDGRKVYCDNFGAFPATVSVHDRVAKTDKSVKVGSTPLGAFTSNDGTEIFLPETLFTIEVMDVKTDKVVRKFRFPDIPVGSIMGPDDRLYVGFATGLIGVYDPKTGKQLEKPIWSGGAATFWYTFSADGKTLYTDTVNTVGVIDIPSWKLTKTIPTTGGTEHKLTDPGAFTSTLSPDGTKLYVCLFGGTGVLVIDTATNKVVRTLPTDGVTTGLVFSADGTRGYISDLGSGTKYLPTPIGEGITFANLITIGALGPGQVIVFDPRTDTIIGDPIPTKAGPGIGAWLHHI